MARTFTNRRYLDAVADHVVVFDGAMGTNIQKLDLTTDDFGGEKLWGCNDYLVISKPEAIETIHASFLAVGCEVIETCTFRSNRITMREYGLQDRIVEINRAAVQLARRVCNRFAQETGVPHFVAGSMGPTGMLPSSSDPALSNITFQALADVFAEQARGLVEGGVDVLLLETQQDILEVKAAVYGINKYFESAGVRVPLQVQVTLDTTGRMLLGTDIAAVLAILDPLAVDVIGLNCSTGPDYMREPVRYLTSHTRKPISVIPNAGLPINVDGVACYPMEPGPMADTLAEFVTELGVNVVGGCCGTTPDHLRALVERVSNTKYPISHLKSEAIEQLPMVASAMRATPLHQEPPPHLIGERINTQGSKATKQLLLNEDYEGIVQVARNQVESGAHTLDVCVALTERADEAAQMSKVVKLLSQSVELPLVLDSTEADVIRAALEVCPGRPIINSINLENGRKRCDAILPLYRDYGAAVIALTIDEAGMAKTAQRKLDIARRIYDIAANEYGLEPDALIFDALTFTLATGDAEFANSAVETLDGIRAIKRELPRVLCSLGVSNLSFGLSGAARGPLNAVFLYHAVAAGLDMAIVNPKQAVPYAEIDPQVRELAEDLIFNRRADALPRYIAYFEEHKEAGAEQKAADPTVGMTAEQKLHWQIVHRRKEGVEALIDDCLTRNQPVWVLNNVLLPAMKEVGDKFGAGELILPYVLQSAEVMKKSVAHLEQFLEKKVADPLQGKGVTKGKIVIATVYGDVHDIGKNLVGTILSNNGYTVFDLGKQVPANVIIDKAVEIGADAIGLSALLVSTSKQMPLIVQELDKRGLKFPVLIGGAAINRRFGRRILYVDGHGYEPGVFYCKDAFEGLETLDTLADDGKRPAFLDRIRREAEQELAGTRSEKVEPQPAASNWKQVEIPQPPREAWGPRVLSSIPLSEVFPYLDKDELFRLSWGAKNAHGEDWEKLRAEFEERLSRMQSRAQHGDWLCPQAVYGYFPCNSDGDVLLVYEPGQGDRVTRASGQGDAGTVEHGKVIARFTFPRQAGQERLSVADYFAPKDSGIVDVVALQVVTVGFGATERFDALQAAGDYGEAYYTHGLAVQTAEATADWLHRRVKKELGIGERGKRYSWGYGACPDLEDHAQVFKLLPAESALGMSLTPAFQLVPEQSTAAIVVHHPDARYFSVGGSRIEQLMRESREVK